MQPYWTWPGGARMVPAPGVARVAAGALDASASRVHAQHCAARPDGACVQCTAGAPCAGTGGPASGHAASPLPRGGWGESIVRSTPARHVPRASLDVVAPDARPPSLVPLPPEWHPPMVLPPTAMPSVPFGPPYVPPHRYRLPRDVPYKAPGSPPDDSDLPWWLLEELEELALWQPAFRLLVLTGDVNCRTMSQELSRIVREPMDAYQVHVWQHWQLTPDEERRITVQELAQLGSTEGPAPANWEVEWCMRTQLMQKVSRIRESYVRLYFGPTPPCPPPTKWRFRGSVYEGVEYVPYGTFPGRCWNSMRSEEELLEEIDEARIYARTGSQFGAMPVFIGNVRSDGRVFPPASGPPAKILRGPGR